MSRLFLYGSLLCRPLLMCVLGSESDVEITDARLNDHAVCWAKDKEFPLIAAAAGAVTEGLLLSNLTRSDLARLDYYEAGFSYHRQSHLVHATAGLVEATVYFPDPNCWTAGKPWSLAEWERRQGAIALRAAEEVMGYFGRVSPDKLALMRPMIELRAASWARAQTGAPPQALHRAFTAEDVRANDPNRPYADFFAVQEQTLRFRRFDGEMSEEVKRAAFVSGDATTVLPYDPQRDRVLLIEQFRYGPFVRGDRQTWSLEPIAGRIDPGETAENAARREAMEEAGLTLTALHHIADYYPSPGAASEFMYSYIGLTDLPDEAAIITGLASEAEDIRGLLLTFDDLMDLVQTGGARNGPLILSALWLAANRDRLRGDA